MEWRFTLIDRYGTNTVIDEPVGWEDIVFKFSRDAENHGIFYDYSSNKLTFWGQGKQVIESEYKTFGIEGFMFLKIEYSCDERSIYERFTTGRILFANNKSTCSDICTIDVALDNISEIVTFKNRLQQSVDLTSLKCFDTVTDLAVYTKAPFTLSLPAKKLLIKSSAMNDAALVSTNLTESDQWYPNTVSGGSLRQMRADIIPGFIKIVSTDILDTTFFNTIELVNGGFGNMPAEGLTPLVDMQDFSTAIKCVSADATINYRYKGSIAHSGGIFGPTLKIYRLPAGLDPLVSANYEELASHFCASAGFDIAETLSVTLNPGDKLWFYLFIFPDFSEDFTDYTITEDPECFLDISINSICDPSDADVFMINEAMSRVTESITNNQLRVYSEYLGRTDSQPFAFPANGDGSLAVVTNGLKLRRVKKADGTIASFFTTFQDLYDSINAIHNLGLGIEKLLPDGDVSNDLTDDLVNAASNNFVLRIENWKWFYKPDTLFTCDDVDVITTTVLPDKHIAKFTCGYDKWEAEQYNGLDEFLTKRIFATQLTQVSNALEKISKAIASGYAIEVTRRQDSTSSDWRYDNDTFIICVTKDDDNYIVELNNILSAENILDPATVYNFRISPIRNLMRWFDKIIASYRNYATVVNPLLFKEGDGNLVAKGELDGSFAKLENGPLSENQNIDASFFADSLKAAPINYFESVQFDYPMTVSQYRSILNNPYGIIGWSRNGKYAEGWIDSISYKPNQGTASFTLIPKILA